MFKKIKEAVLIDGKRISPHLQILLTASVFLLLAILALIMNLMLSQ